MDRKVALVAILIVLLIIVSICSYYLVFRMPIKASPEELVLATQDMPGWIPGTTGGVFGFHYSYGPAPTPQTEIVVNYYNVTLAFGMAIVVKSFRSSGDASQFYSALTDKSGNYYHLNQTISEVDQGLVANYTMRWGNPYNYNYTEIIEGYFWDFNFRIANVVVLLQFGEIIPEGSTIAPPIQDWMNDIASNQVQKIQQFNIHL